MRGQFWGLFQLWFRGWASVSLGVDFGVGAVIRSGVGTCISLGVGLGMGAGVSVGISLGVVAGVGASIMFGICLGVHLAVGLGIGSGRLVLYKIECLGFVVGHVKHHIFWYGEQIQACKLSVDSVKIANVCCVTWSHFHFSLPL